MSKRDYYDVLGVGKSATDQEIKSAYRKLAKKYHPDVSQEENAADKFKEVQEAYDTLSDSGKRQRYDQFGHAGDQFGGGAGGFGGFGGGFGGAGGFEDILSSFFGGGGQRRQDPNAPRKGRDTTMQMNITFEEAVFGAKKHINVTFDEVCTDCHGTGAHSKNDVKTCSQCHGRGSVTVEQNSIFGRMQQQVTCPKCGGTGKEVTKKCEKCKGKGTNRVTKTIEVEIPAGVDSGQELRLQGKGEGGVNGGPSGDLYIRFNVARSKEFERDGYDIYLELPVSFTDVALGADIKVPTIHGNVELNIPAGTQTGTMFKLRGKGIKHLRANKHGDQMVIVKVITPTKISNEQRDLLKKLSKFEDKKESFFDKINIFKK